jgi:hypothetical protein
MESNDKYTVKLSDLSKDTTRYEFHLDNEFFSMVKDATIEKGDLLAVVTIKKGPESFRFDFSIKGKVVVHPEGQCNQEMESRLAAMTTTTVREDNDSESEQEGGEDAMDPRWEILRKLKNDDNKE